MNRPARGASIGARGDGPSFARPGSPAAVEDRGPVEAERPEHPPHARRPGVHLRVVEDDTAPVVHAGSRRGDHLIEPVHELRNARVDIGARPFPPLLGEARCDVARPAHTGQRGDVFGDDVREGAERVVRHRRQPERERRREDGHPCRAPCLGQKEPAGIGDRSRRIGPPLNDRAHHVVEDRLGCQPGAGLGQQLRRIAFDDVSHRTIVPGPAL